MLVSLLHISICSPFWHLRTFFIWFTSCPSNINFIFFYLLSFNKKLWHFCSFFYFIFTLLLYHIFLKFATKKEIICIFSHIISFFYTLLIIFSFNFKICFWMATYRTYFWSFLSNYYMSAISAFPNSISIFTKYQITFYVF